eukprot:scaffold6724_cov104-Isochrysis_galbana.AAC.3
MRRCPRQRQPLPLTSRLLPQPPAPVPLLPRGSRHAGQPAEAQLQQSSVRPGRRSEATRRGAQAELPGARAPAHRLAAAAGATHQRLLPRRQRRAPDLSALAPAARPCEHKELGVNERPIRDGQPRLHLPLTGQEASVQLSSARHARPPLPHIGHVAASEGREGCLGQPLLPRGRHAQK